MKLKLEQGQVWQQGDTYLRIVKWSRQAIDYKAFTDIVSREGPVTNVSKKEFCRLIKGAGLMTLDQINAATAIATEKAAETATPVEDQAIVEAEPEPLPA